GSGQSDKTWCLVMEIDAAGRVQDKKGYESLLTQMRALTGENDIAAALAVGIGENDFPLWATSLVQQAAAMIGDRETYALLSRPIADLMNSLPERSGDYILGRCTHAMAQIYQYQESHSLPQETKTPAADVQTSGPGCAIWPVMATGMILYAGVATDWEGVNTANKMAIEDWHWDFNENLRQERMAMKTGAATPDGFESLSKWFDESTSGIDAAAYRTELQVRDWADQNPQQATAMTWAISLLAVSAVVFGACRQWRHHKAASHKGEVPPSPP
ncbi:MAG TPA: hypothetical protein DIS76_06305, partial [Rhodospirillaceae bacterium]|nr:hypothetical protein [Rhodospirillaceae bacterium]